MSQAKTERLVNLTMALMAAPRFVTVGEIGRIVAGYEPDGSPDGGEAFRRMFERDKEELRELGIPLATGPIDPLWGDDIGYRIPRNDYALPALTLDPDEAAALGLAARLWSSTGLAAATTAALRKLAAAGVEPLPPPEGLEARVDATEPAFGPLYDAVLAAREVGFPYRRPGAEEQQRRLQPWGVVSTSGHWYVAGHDLDRGAARVFRLSRITGDVKAVGPAAAYTVPAGTDIRAIVVDAESPEPTATATVRVQPGTCQRLRRGAQPVDGDPDLLAVPYAGLNRFADLVVGHGPDAVVLEPAELRELVVSRLRAVVEAATVAPLPSVPA